MRGAALMIAASMTAEQFQSAHSAHFAGAGIVRRTDSTGRESWRGPSGSGGLQADLTAHRIEMNTRTIDEALARNSGGRRDGFSSGAGFHLARDLEHIMGEVLEEQFEIPSAMELFSVDESVPAGANSYAMRRLYFNGEARVYRGPGTHIPRVGMQQREESWPIRHLVAGFGWDIFEAASSQFANSNIVATGMRNARDSILRLANKIWWGLDGVGEPHGLYGVLNYPFLPKVDIASGFSRATVAADPDTALGELHDLVNFPVNTTRGTLRPDTMVMSPRVEQVLSSVRFAAGSDTTVLEQFKKNRPDITIKTAFELEDAGGTGIDGILAYKDGPRGVMLVQPQGVTQLPVEVRGLSSEVINYSSIGGANMPDVMSNILGFADTTA